MNSYKAGVSRNVLDCWISVAKVMVAESHFAARHCPQHIVECAIETKELRFTSATIAHHMVFISASFAPAKSTVITQFGIV